MASIQQSMNHSMLPSALANAALLIAAPSLGCLKTYTRTFTDLCKAYGLPVPDLTHILKHKAELSAMQSTMITPVRSSFTITPKKLVKCLETNHDTMDLQELKLELSDISNEYDIPKFNEEYYCLSSSSSLVSKLLGSNITITQDHDTSNDQEDIDSSSFSSDDNTAIAFDNLDWFDDYESPASLQLLTLSSSQVVTDPHSPSIKTNTTPSSVESPLMLKNISSSETDQNTCTINVQPVTDPHSPSIKTISTPSSLTSPVMPKTISSSKTNQKIATINVQQVQKPFSCPLCNRRFSLRQSLLIHRVTEVCRNADRFLRPVTGGWTCTSCSKVFSHLAQAQRHTWGTLTCSLDRGLSCPVCHKEFAENACNFLVKHVKTTHQEYFDNLDC